MVDNFASIIDIVFYGALGVRQLSIGVCNNNFQDHCILMEYQLDNCLYVGAKLPKEWAAKNPLGSMVEALRLKGRRLAIQKYRSFQPCNARQASLENLPRPKFSPLHLWKIGSDPRQVQGLGSRPSYTGRGILEARKVFMTGTRWGSRALSEQPRRWNIPGQWGNMQFSNGKINMASHQSYLG
ncbi:uncharacterized protein LOC131326814 [Rhododendron vialii]|uniref:uncharacterized protein LOC131326814 n=1 Tax=Rhododendron vialii TaxID=182163 RepID=UPI00265ECBB9|nr:uncharacterized protein LOC131326814 [Rhododendron vialii]